jgi:hypothetical protein
VASLSPFHFFIFESFPPKYSYFASDGSVTFIKKWGLPVLEHPEPYILYSLEDPEFKDMADVLVTKQVRVSFTIGDYEDDVLCDVVPSKTRDLLLGLPWQQQRRPKHDQHNDECNSLDKMFSLDKNNKVIIE